MGKDDGLVKAALIIGGLALLAKIIEEAQKNKGKIYRCWRCNQVISKDTPTCPHCHAPQDWRRLQ